MFFDLCGTYSLDDFDRKACECGGGGKAILVGGGYVTIDKIGQQIFESARKLAVKTRCFLVIGKQG